MTGAPPPARLDVRGLLARVLRRLLYRQRLLYWRLQLGSHLQTRGIVRLGPGLVLKPRGSGYIELDHEVELEYGVNIESRGSLRIGQRTFVGHGTTIGCNEHLSIGRNCLIGEYVSIRDNDHEFRVLATPIQDQGQRVAPVIIGDDVWIGAKATVTPGVRIGDGCVVGANAVVTHDLPANAIAVGVPARVIRRRGES